MIEELHKLQNGTDIRGIAIENPEKKVNLTTVEVKAIAGGFVKWLKDKKNIKKEKIKIAVGMDSRLSGPEIKEVILNELVNLGCSVYDCGLCTTPAMFMTTVLEDYKCDGSIMITASHLPYYHNGLKFFTENGGCEKENIKYILDSAVEKDFKYPSYKGEISKVDFIDTYSSLLVEKIRKGINSNENYEMPLSKFKIIVDAGNGAGGFFASKVLKKLGAEVEGSQFINPDGRFPNHIPNPEAKEAMDSIRKAVLENKADLGIVFDADVDRAAIVDAGGMEINRNSLIALISSIILEEHPGSTIVTDSVTSNGLSEFIENLGGKHHRFKRGYRNVINEGIRLNEQGEKCYLAIETSGHAALKENYFLDDGAYLISKILVKMAKLHKQGKSIEDLIKSLKISPESLEFRFNILNSNFKDYGYKILDDLKNYVEKINGWNEAPNNYEGVRVNCNKLNGDGWFLLRISLHEPVLCLNIESDSKDGIKVIMDNLKNFLINYNELNISSFK
ncbi:MULTISPECIES: phosphoglucomutase [Clostridium]|uniref:Phosphomannomutase/phosphoglucomutase n=1 Tax=Clostridium ragsdalei P11 TaxID=1353534 RepID=A0A1A6AK01_9CLOT|nr:MULTISPECIES: phosphoglucomutase [Clostridium]OBR90328.1 phosphomannomutase/phosphoglucomutase [Clostridium ragsdalei P11]QXE18132.1 phosphomannomutase/phosphoglucomutase [Clostridium sp. 001]